MLIYFLISLIQSKYTICICNGDCPSSYAHNTFDASHQNANFRDFFLSSIQNEDDIELNMYSKSDNFVFTVDSSLFSHKKVTFKAHETSSPVFLQMKKKLQLFQKKIEIKPNSEYVINDQKKVQSERKVKDVQTRLLPEPLPPSVSVPISIGIAQMKPTGNPTCAFLSGYSGNYQDQPFNESKSSQEYYCNKQNLESVDAYNCGWRCYGSNAGYSYTFRGVKFALYGTFNSNHEKFDVELDGEIITEVDENYPSRVAYSLLYASPLLAYGDHTVKLIGKSQMYEFYKLTFWPSMTAKRVNSSSFTLNGEWKSESDGIGGIRHYKDDNVQKTASISLNCSKFWIYGVKFSHLGTFTINYNGTVQTINQQGNRDEGVLLFESPELENTSVKINFQADNNKVMMIYCIFYEEVSVPISIGLKEMTFSQGIKCGYYYSGNNSVVTLNKSIGSQKIGCEHTNLNSQNAYTCGLKCWTNSGSYTYKFLGVKFAVYGTYNTGHGRMKIELDNEEIAIVDQSVRNQPYAQLYKSNLLEYKEHTIKISHYSGNAYELYKIAYWPSITAKRINATELTLKEGTWTTESDGIGGNRIYCSSSGGSFILTLRCSKFWIYGLKDKGYGNIQLSFNGIIKNLVQNSNERIENTLLFESPELNTSQTTITLYLNGVYMLNYIFYEEIAKPVETPIPISVGLKQMTKEGTIENCNIAYGTSIDNINCPIENLHLPSAYQCGMQCWGNSLNFSYSFKGVKFAVIGTYEVTFGTIHISLDGKTIADINTHAPRYDYALLYESEILNYKQHTVKIYSTDLHQIYKLIYWPSMFAKRINSTSFTKYESEYIDKSDGIGGVQEMVRNGGSSSSFSLSMNCIKFWFYGTSRSGNNGVTLTYNGNKKKIDLISDQQINGVLLLDSDQFDYTSLSLTATTYGNAILYCVYYIEKPLTGYEYINKTFRKVLPYSYIEVTPNSNINQISGCDFNNIIEEFDYLITLKKSVQFFDNNFLFDPDLSNPSSPINIKFNGNIEIKNCTFTNSRFKSIYGGNVFYCNSGKTVSATFKECKFINCGNSQKQQIILIESIGSSLKLNDCYFDSTSPTPPKSIKTSCENVYINNCNFNKLSEVEIEIKSDSNAILLSTPEISITNSTFNRCIGNPIKCLSININKLSSITFDDNVISNNEVNSNEAQSIRIDLNHFIPELIIRNLLFINNSCLSHWGGGTGMAFHDTSRIVISNCSFINNEAKKSSTPRNSIHLYTNIGFDYYNGDGGAIQIGFSCFNKNAEIKFEDCTFTNNKAAKHGGAIAIQTVNTVEIINCAFKLNKADVDFDSSKAIFLAENHYNKKDKGRGGAIYINPTFSYSSDIESCTNNFNTYMTSILIKDCSFLSNSAYDGYAIYIEGEDLGTEFDFKSNDFDDNYNFAQSANNDPNLTVRGVIATEIHSIKSENVLENNNFNNVRSKKFIYVDHYGTRIATDYFSESADFTYSKDFTKSESFSNSAKFTKSDMFSNSFEFSESKAFSKSDAFSKTFQFSESEVFSKSNAFPSTNQFSESEHFSKSNAFPSTNQFSESEAFSKSDVFISTYQFSQSNAFSKSDIFDKTLQFTQSESFSKSNSFTNTHQSIKSMSLSKSNAFEKTLQFSESGAFSKSNAFEKTIQFSQSNAFSKSDVFDKTLQFTQSEYFSKSNSFTNTHQSIKSMSLSKSNAFEKTFQFSESEAFSKSNAFDKTLQFSESGAFTNSNQFSKSQNFAPSSEFTGSSSFSNTKEVIKIQTAIAESSEEAILDSSETSNSIIPSIETSVESSKSDIISSEKASSINIDPTESQSLIVSFTKTSTPSQAGDIDDPNISIKSGKNKKLPMIIGLIVGLIILILIIIIIIIFVIRRKKQKEGEDEIEFSVETNQTNISNSLGQDFDNPLYQNQIDHDPFIETFEEND